MNPIGVIYDLQGHLICRRPVLTPPKGSLANRGCISGFSERSGSRMRRYLRCCVVHYVVLITLTYPAVFPVDGRDCKDHFRKFIQRLKRWHLHQGYSESSFSAFWFIEFQERGAPHFHIFFTHRVPKELVARAWFESVGSDDERHLLAGTRIEAIRSGRWGMCCYASKYAAKAEQKVVPPEFENIGRFWGVWGQRRTMAASIFVPIDRSQSSTFEAFRVQLRQILRTWRRKIRVLPAIGTSSCVILGDTRLIEETKALFLTFGPLLEKEGCAFTYPERDLLTGGEYELPLA